MNLPASHSRLQDREKEFFIDILLVRSHLIIEMILIAHFKGEVFLQVSISYTIGAIARPEQASHEVGTPYPGTHRLLKRRGFKTQHVR